VEDIVAAGFSALHSIEAASGMSLAALRRQYHGRLCLMGNLDLHVLLTADGAELELAVRQVLAEGNGQGGFIFGTSGGLTAEVELERLRLVARCLAESGSRG
ncbi:MAG: uroporphyrinogen decarboxylase family protein, partial [Syntrophomonadaceae bacterium]|jgi:uroporphyrinogen-III decarboxylase|nr:uroporphyrinogen decarboxylase family protein [Syntrophomonadaceae bacterium]